MDSQLVQQLILLGMFVKSTPSVALGQLEDIYARVSIDEAQIIHAAIMEMIEQFCKMDSVQDNFARAQQVEVFVELANIPVPGLNNQNQLSHGTEEIEKHIVALEKEHPLWVEMLETFEPSNFWIRNDEALNILIGDIPLQVNKGEKRAFLHELGENRSTAYFIVMLSNKYGLEQPYYPFDWAKNAYFLMGFHLSSPSPEILNARDHFWNTLIQLSQTKLPLPHPIQNQR